MFVLGLTLTNLSAFPSRATTRLNPPTHPNTALTSPWSQSATPPKHPQAARALPLHNTDNNSTHNKSANRSPTSVPKCPTRPHPRRRNRRRQNLTSNHPHNSPSSARRVPYETRFVERRRILSSRGRSQLCRERPSRIRVDTMCRRSRVDQTPWCSRLSSLPSSEHSTCQAKRRNLPP